MLPPPEPPGLTDAIIVVSGLPRSGTSLMMSMLAAGGVALVTDGVRRADVDNPRGYFEFEPVKRLPDRTEWLGDARGKAVKVVSPLLERLPRDYRYAVLLLRRPLDDVLGSQAVMRARRGVGPTLDPDHLRREFEAHLAATARFLEREPAFTSLDVPYRELVAEPAALVAGIARFLGRPLDHAAMCACVEPTLDRQRPRS